MAKIERVVKGQHPSLLDAGKANELISKINGILESSGTDPIIVSVDDNGKLTVEIGFSARDIILCVNGEPYNTQILTGPLTEVT